MKMKDRIEDVLAQFESGGAGQSDNAHVLEQFFGMDSLTAAELAALERAVDAGQEADTAVGADKDSVKAAISTSLSNESAEIQSSAAVMAVQSALTSQQVTDATTGADVIAAVEEVVADVVDEALAATDMDTSLFVPIAVEEIREGTVRTEVIENRDDALAQIASQATQAEQDAKREELLGKTTVVDRTPDPVTPKPEGQPEAIVVLSNADDKVVSTSGNDDRFEVVPQVFVNEVTGAELTGDADSQGFGRDVIIDLDDRVETTPVASADETIYETVVDDGGTPDDVTDDSTQQVVAQQVDKNALGDVIYLEGVNDISTVGFSRFQVGREGENSLKITTTVTSDELSDEGNAIANSGEVTVFKQFDGLTDRFAVETLEISDTAGNSEYWSLSQADSVRDGGRVTETYVTTDVSNTGKGILVGSAGSDEFRVDSNYGGTDSVEVLLTSFDSNDSIDLSAFGSGLTTSTVDGNVEVSDEGGNVKLTLIGITDPVSIDEQLVLTATAP